MRKKHFILIFVLVLCQPIFISGGQEVNKVKNTLSLSDAIISQGRQTRLMVSVPADHEAVPEIPEVQGLEIRYMGRSSGADGETVHTYRVLAVNEGKYTIGPVFIEYAGQKKSLGITDLNVVSDVSRALRGAGFETAVVAAGATELAGRIFLDVELPSRVVYVNETIPVKIRLYSDWLDVENIVITDEPSKNYISGEYVQGNTGIVPKDGVNFAVLEYKRDLFVTQPGDYTFGPVRASFDVAQKKDTPLNANESFYDAYIGRVSKRKAQVESPVIPLKVSAVPRDGMPAEFNGSLGKFSMKAVFRHPDNVKEGDTVIAEAEVTGEGVLTSRTVPVISPRAGFEVTDQNVKKTGTGLWVSYQIKVSGSGEKVLPDIVFSYFDPETGKFVTLKETGKTIQIEPVAPSGGEEADLSSEGEREDPIAGVKQTPGRSYSGEILFYKSRWMFFVLTLPVFLVTVAAGIKKRIDILNSDTPYARRIRAAALVAAKTGEIRKALRSAVPDVFYGTLSQVLRDYLSLRFLIPTRDISVQSAAKYLGPKINDDELLARITGILEDINFARFSTLEYEKKDMLSAFKDFKRIVDSLNRRKFS